MGQILNPLADDKCEFFRNGALELVQRGDNWEIGRCCGRSEADLDGAQVEDLDGQLIMPALFDIHFHWVQDDVRTMPKAKLLEWLEKYTFPAERKFEDRSYSKAKAREFFARLVKTGTLGGAIYSSVHEHALRDAQDAAVGHFAVGNVQMTMNSPDFLTQSKAEAVELSKRLAKEYGPRYALTPRFAIATDPETMQETAKAAKENGCFIQTHLSENTGEIEFVMEIYRKLPGFEDVENYTEIYERAGLLGPKTIMGHGIHLSQRELKLLAKTQTVIAHCPTSNAPIDQLGLGSGLFDWRRTERAGVRWALASDIGGGPILSMFDVMRSFVDQNRQAGVETTFVKALCRCTLAGAEAMGLEKLCGNFEAGKEANFLVLAGENGAQSAEEVLEAVAQRGRERRDQYDSLPRRVYFQGERLA